MALPRTVLIVEDEEILARNLLTYLERCGWEGRIAATGRQAVDSVTGFRPRAILLDYHLPDMNGFAALAAIRQQHPACACILMTGHPTQVVVSGARRLGIRRILGKPFSLSELQDCLAAEIDTLQPGAE